MPFGVDEDNKGSSSSRKGLISLALIFLAAVGTAGYLLFHSSSPLVLDKGGSSDHDYYIRVETYYDYSRKSRTASITDQEEFTQWPREFGQGVNAGDSFCAGRDCQEFVITLLNVTSGMAFVQFDAQIKCDGRDSMRKQNIFRALVNKGETSSFNYESCVDENSQFKATYNHYVAFEVVGKV